MLSPTEEVLKLPEVIAQSKGYRIVVCVDEFQQIGDFPDSLTFQKKLRGIVAQKESVERMISTLCTLLHVLIHHGAYATV